MRQYRLLLPSVIVLLLCAMTPAVGRCQEAASTPPVSTGASATAIPASGNRTIVPTAPAQVTLPPTVSQAPRADANKSDASGATADSTSGLPAVMTENTVMDLGKRPDRVTFTFQEAPWGEVLREFADWAGLTLDMSDTPPGYFNYFDSRSHTPSQAIDILNGYLLPRGYVVLRRDQFLVAIRTTNDMLSNLIPTVSVEELINSDGRGDNELVKIIVDVDELTPEEAAEEVRGLLGPFGAATPLANSASVVLQGFGSGLRQALLTLQKSRPPVTDDKLDFRSFSLVHLPVADAESQIRKLFGLASPLAPVNVSDARFQIDRAAYYRDRETRDARDKSRETAAPPIPLLKKVAMNMQVSSLERTNNLLVTATPEGLKLVEQILLSIDVPSDDKNASWSHDSKPELRVYKVNSADEGEVSKTIDALLPGLVVNEDRRQDTIHVFATASQHTEVEQLIKKLEAGAGTGGTIVEVIPLHRSNPTAAASLLSGMFLNVDRDDRPVIQAEIPTRSLVVRGSTFQISEIREALTKFGEPAAPISSETVARQSRVRRIAIGGRSAAAIAEAAQRILTSDKEFQGSIRVVVPGQAKSGHAKSDRVETVPVKSKPTPTDAVQTRLNSNDIVKTRLISKADVSSAQAPATQAPRNEPPRRSSSQSVSIEVQGDELLVYSGDPQALDAVEITIRELVNQMPDSTRWTIFYLTVAEAEKAALKLMDLMSDAIYPTQSTLSISDVDFQPLRIIADKRTNAIFVSGSVAQVEEAEGFLEYIDAADVPGSFVRREPHAIKVEHADVDEIAELISTLYKDYLVDPVAERLKAESEKSRSTSTRSIVDLSESPGIRLTVAVDRKTGELLVACNDQLFAEIESVVRERDAAVRDSEPTIEFVHVSGDLPDNIIEMLGGMSSKITAEAILPSVDATRSTSKSTSSKSIRK